jgi:hypothetical protein
VGWRGGLGDGDAADNCAGEAGPWEEGRAGICDCFFAEFVWMGGGLCASMRGSASSLRLTGGGMCASVWKRAASIFLLFFFLSVYIHS